MSQTSTSPALPDRFEPVGEIGRGGMGVVWRVTDRQFGRSVAVKLLHPSLREDSESVNRFEREALITGSLQHPAIPPVLDRGRLEDGTPYFSMKLIEGDTLATLLDRRSSPKEDVASLVTIFEHVCQAVGYAHSQGIIHRDLKPSNIMVGAFGEVQVMDWGMAKKLDDDTEAVVDQALASGPAPSAGNADDTLVFQGNTGIGGGSTVDSENLELTRAGQVIGTLSYMPPEQARGDHGVVDERADVFAIGGILCKILTGEAPYWHDDFDHLYLQVAQGDLSGAIALLEACDRDDELVDLCRRCLDPDPVNRPANAESIANEIREFEENTRRRLDVERAEHVAAEARAAEEKKRRRMTVVAAVMSLVVAVLLVVGGWWYQQAQLVESSRRMNEQAAKELAANRALNDVEASLTLLPELRRTHQFDSSLALLRRANSRLGDLPDAKDLFATIRDETRDVRMLRDLDRIRMESRAVSHSGLHTGAVKGRDGDYATAFLAYGIDVLQGEEKDVAELIDGTPIRRELISGLDDWVLHEEPAVSAKIRRILTLVDGDSPWNQFRDPQFWRTQKFQSLPLDELNYREASPAIASRIHHQCRNNANLPRAIEIMERIAEHHPDDFWIHFDLAIALGEAGRSVESQLGHYRAALAVRPDSIAVYNNMAIVLDGQKRFSEAVRLCRRAMEIDPDATPSFIYNKLGVSLKSQNLADEAEVAYREAIRRNDKYADAYCNWGSLLVSTKDYEEAEKKILKAIELRPDYALYHLNLGECYLNQGDHSAAEKAYVDARRLAPGDKVALSRLGAFYRSQGRYSDAEQAFRDRLELGPPSAETWWSLGVVLEKQKKVGAAEEAYRKAWDVDPSFRDAPNSLGVLQTNLGRLDEAEVSLSIAIRMAPKWYLPHFNLGFVFMHRSQMEMAEDCFRETIKRNDEFVPAYGMLSSALQAQGRYDEALEVAQNGLKRSMPGSANAARFDRAIQKIRGLMEENASNPDTE